MVVGGVAGGYPPMTPLRGAVPSWQEEWLTQASSPEQARAVLLAEAHTSVLHPVGLRWNLVRRLARAVQVVAWLCLAALLVRSLVLHVDVGPPLAPVVLAFVVSLTAGLLPWSVLRAVPGPAALPRTRSGRRRLTLDAVRGRVEGTAPAPWPRGSEAYAVLSTIGATDGIDVPWLLDRAGLPPAIGAQWVASLAHLRWLSGGEDFVHGWLRQPVRLTDAGRARLEVERERLHALAEV